MSESIKLPHPSEAWETGSYTEEVLPELRWLNGVLQQQVRRMHSLYGAIYSIENYWRDVPGASEDD